MATATMARVRKSKTDTSDLTSGTSSADLSSNIKEDTDTISLVETGARKRGIVVTAANHKGGVGKSTLVVNLADAFRRMGKAVLVIDMDAQANSSQTLLGTDYSPSPDINVMEAIFHAGSDINRYIVEKTTIKGVHLIAGTIRLMRIEERLRGATLIPAGIFKRKMDFIREEYDVIFVDTPPNLWPMPAIALAASDFYFVPIQVGSSYSLDGVDDLLNLVKQVQEMSPNLQFGGVILNQHDKRRRIDRGVLKAVEEMFPGKILSVHIPDATGFKMATAGCTTVLESERDGVAAVAITSLAKEMATIIGLEVKS